eukprot:sb/3466979/
MPYLQRKNAKKPPQKGGMFFIMRPPRDPSPLQQANNNGELFGKKASKSTRKKSSIPAIDPDDPYEVVLRQAFELFDQDGNGTITIEEVRIALKTLGQDVSDEEVAELMGDVDKDGDNCIGYEERDCYVDKDGDNCIGYEERDWTITIEEVRIALKTLGQDVSDEEVAELMGDVDKDGDNCIGYDEFKQMINKLDEAENNLYNAYIEETFRVFDVDNDKLITPKDLKHTLCKLGLQCSTDEVCDTIRDSLKDVKGHRHRSARETMPALAEEGERTIERRPVSRASHLPSEEKEPAILGVGMEELKIIAKCWPRPI